MKNVREFIGERKPEVDLLDMEHPVTIGSYMNEPDIINNKYQLHQAMKLAASWLPTIYEEYEKISGRNYGLVRECQMADAQTAILFSVLPIIQPGRPCTTAFGGKTGRSIYSQCASSLSGEGSL